ncbi:MAG: hypothetical protein NZ483_10915 [Verrucomicrobiae bacterium]|nr:hypothetical protein [Verrucomicrobiae bacterium]
MKAKIGKEVVVRIRNQIGLLAQISKLVAEKGINILAAAGWVEGSDGVVHLVTEDNLRVMDALRQKNFNPHEVDVVLVETAHKPGMLKHIAETLAGAGLDIHHLYATATADQNRALVVFACSNNDRAVVLLS